ncbi:unnamed protein product [Ambrosiozyma monospora]|uniref:Unnamed protein product n=1 Tax=Ambrosiozyma monospora TaxID=43982 RepID=A0ACB5T0D3_AMBMO|nr:unnamed protein product [Ambrosiozyma monospora]
MESWLSREVENARLVRLMTKLESICDRPERGSDGAWSETGERYPVKLFKDYVFHQVNESGHPVVDLTHVVNCLNKLDAGSEETLLLVSPDETTCLIMSYRNLKQLVDKSFSQLTGANSMLITRKLSHLPLISLRTEEYCDDDRDQSPTRMVNHRTRKRIIVNIQPLPIVKYHPIPLPYKPAEPKPIIKDHPTPIPRTPPNYKKKRRHRIKSGRKNRNKKRKNRKGKSRGFGRFSLHRNKDTELQDDEEQDVLQVQKQQQINPLRQADSLAVLVARVGSPQQNSPRLQGIQQFQQHQQQLQQQQNAIRLQVQRKQQPNPHFEPDGGHSNDSSATPVFHMPPVRPSPNQYSALYRYSQVSFNQDFHQQSNDYNCNPTLRQYQFKQDNHDHDHDHDHEHGSFEGQQQAAPDFNHDDEEEEIEGDGKDKDEVNEEMDKKRGFFVYYRHDNDENELKISNFNVFNNFKGFRNWLMRPRTSNGQAEQEGQQRQLEDADEIDPELLEAATILENFDSQMEPDKSDDEDRNHGRSAHARFADSPINVIEFFGVDSALSQQHQYQQEQQQRSPIEPVEPYKERTEFDVRSGSIVDPDSRFPQPINYQSPLPLPQQYPIKYQDQPLLQGQYEAYPESQYHPSQDPSTEEYAMNQRREQAQRNPYFLERTLGHETDQALPFSLDWKNRLHFAAERIFSDITNNQSFYYNKSHHGTYSRGGLINRVITASTHKITDNQNWHVAQGYGYGPANQKQKKKLFKNHINDASLSAALLANGKPGLTIRKTNIGAGLNGLNVYDERLQHRYSNYLPKRNVGQNTGVNNDVNDGSYSAPVSGTDDESGSGSCEIEHSASVKKLLDKVDVERISYEIDGEAFCDYEDSGDECEEEANGQGKFKDHYEGFDDGNSFTGTVVISQYAAVNSGSNVGNGNALQMVANSVSSMGALRLFSSGELNGD